ncbi:MAG: hypothetical protein JNL90_14335 [Planctomycetes bacterium]|nr:hypothetical protein [Planctomycetota bacterium]
MPSRPASLVTHLLFGGSLLLAGCAGPAASPAASSAARSAAAPAEGTTTGAPAPRLTVLTAAPSGALPIATPPAAPAPLAHGDLFAPPPPPTAELDLAAFRGQVVWITFFAADC